MIIKKFKIVILAALVFVTGFFVFHSKRISTIRSIHKIMEFDDGYGIYSMEVKYNYDLEKILNGEITNDNDYIKAITKEVLPGIPVKIKSPKFGCSAFRMKYYNGHYIMGRNYDFSKDTSALVIYNSPKIGYKSISVADLNNLKVNDATKNLKSRMTCIAAPFAVLDGINEKGVSIAVLVVDSPSTHQNNGKPDLPTTLAIRLVLDRAASTNEAIELLSKYDMYAVGGYDYHFYISDSTGDGCAVEFDPHSEERKLVATRTPAVTNFYEIYKDKVLPNQRNGIYGHGKERYEKIIEIIESKKNDSDEKTGWNALKAAAQESNPKEATSNTQWSILYDNTDCSMRLVQRRRWDNFIYDFSIKRWGKE